MPKKKDSLSPAQLACEDRCVLLEQDAGRMSIPQWVLDAATSELETYTKALEQTKKPGQARDAARAASKWRTREGLDDIAAKHGVRRGVLETFANDVHYAYRFIESAWRNAR